MSKFFKDVANNKLKIAGAKKKKDLSGDRKHDARSFVYNCTKVKCT